MGGVEGRTSALRHCLANCARWHILPCCFAWVVFDRQSILALGYDIKRVGSTTGLSWEFGKTVTTDDGDDLATYEPRPFPTEHIHVPAEVKKLGDLLAENVHDVRRALADRFRVTRVQCLCRR